MFPYLVLGIAILAGLILASRWFVSADPRTIVKVLKWGLLGLVGSVALFFILTGRLAWAFWLVPALLPFLMRTRQAARMAKNFQRMAGSMQGQGSGEQSGLETRFLAMRLDHDSGLMNGDVLEGPYRGRSLSQLSLAELVDLLRICWTEDEESAQVLEAYLDRQHPDWREEARRMAGDAGAGGGPGPAGGRMDRAEALRVLGLDEGASRDDIKRAYHQLIANLHPDKGGSDYLAAKINEAKDVLLSS